jgi:hypothetical protein
MLFFTLLLSALSFAGDNTADDNTLTLSRHVEVRSCASKKHCGEWRSLGEDPAVLKFTPVGRGKNGGFDAWSRQNLKTNGTTIKTEIHFVRHKNTSASKYFVYLMIRTGKRHGQTLGYNMRTLTELRERALIDKRSGKLQARMVIGP